jgi:O-antigen ligase
VELSTRIFPSGWRIPIIAVVLAAIVGISLLPEGIFVPFGLLVLLGFVWTFARPARALSVVILGDLILLSTSKGITLVELTFGVYLFGYLGFWLWKRIFIDCQPIVEHAADYFLISFFVIGICTLPISVLGGQTALWWFRELLTFSQLLMYFPMRDAMRDRKGMVTLSIALLVLFCIVSVYNLVNYKAASAVVSYLWELSASRQAFGDNFFFPGVVVLVSLWIHLRRRLYAWLLVPPLALIALALALTFSRGFWLAAVIALIILFFLTGPRERFRLAFSTLGGGAVGFLLLNLFLGKMVQSVLNALVVRVVSARGALMDVSVTNRLVESREAIKKILEQPIIGYGVGSEFARFNIIDHATTVTLYMHNGYLFLLYKTGIIGFIPYMAFLLIVIWTGIRLSFDAALDDVQRGLVRAFAAILPAMLVVNTTSNVFIQKQALLVLAFGTACVMGGHAARKAAAAEAGETG